jgi:thiamine biosynthesis lipoprotein
VDERWSDASPPLEETTVSSRLMGGLVTLVIAHVPGERSAAVRDLRIVMARIERWAARLSRFSGESELSRLNRDPRCPSTRVGPTLAAALDAASGVAARTDGAVDVGLLDARLAAESLLEGPGSRTRGSWWLERGDRGGTVLRDGNVRLDLDGIAKGWIADRALRLLASYPAALVDADGDIAVRDSIGLDWNVGIDDPHADQRDLATLLLEPLVGRGTWGMATSGTSRHGWRVGETTRHHIIDPATGAPAITDVIQATVLARSAAEAEGLAKLAVIRGSDGAWPRLEQDAAAAVLALEGGRVRVTPSTVAWLAP